MNNAIYLFDYPVNEPVLSYGVKSSERELLKKELERQSNEVIDIPLIIGGKEVRTGNIGNVVMPHDHKHVLATYHKAGEEEIKSAIDAAVKAQKDWANLSYVDRASFTLKVAELISTKYRARINAATMLGQSKNAFQAEIDSACEATDFLTFNAHYASNIYQEQPHSDNGVVNRLEYRPLEGFVFSLTPFNFTAIASNLNLSPVLMGNVSLWKPSTTAIMSNYALMDIFREAGLPAGVINFLPGSGAVLGKHIFSSKHFAGLHFTGSSSTFDNLWLTIAQNLGIYKSYPRIVGETGGKDYIIAHPSACSTQVAVAIARGAFEYQGQKCSAASRAYIPKSMWEKVKTKVADMVADMKMGDVRDFSNFINAVIDETSFDNIMNYINIAKNSNEAEIVIGGKGDKSKGYFVEPTVIKTTNPHFITMEEEIFGPVITIYVYDDNDYYDTLKLLDQTSPYALTGAVFANDRIVIEKTFNELRFSAGNFYINDKPTGAVVGQQPFGGSRKSGTNDKAGSYLNLLRWVNPRTIKETLNPPVDYKYPFLKES